jgi:hypothetical protein
VHPSGPGEERLRAVLSPSGLDRGERLPASFARTVDPDKPVTRQANPIGPPSLDPGWRPIRGDRGRNLAVASAFGLWPGGAPGEQGVDLNHRRGAVHAVGLPVLEEQSA